MKRWILILFFMTLSLAASAQYVRRSGSHLTRDKQPISLEEQQQILSGINGVDYTKVWKDYDGWRKTGLGLTIGGSIVAGAGVCTFLFGATVSIFGIVIGATAGAIGGSGGSASGADAGAKAGQPFMTGGLIATGVGAIALGAGIPLLAINGQRMNNIVREYNATLPAEPAPAVVAFGPAPSGIGFTVSF